MRVKAEHDFKPGEVIELIDGELPQMPLGSRVVVEEQSGAASPRSVTYREKNGSLTWRPAEFFRRVIESPIRKVTRRELFPGVYDRVEIGRHRNAAISVGLTNESTGKASVGTFLDANELRSAAMVLSQLAEFLDEDKGDE